MHALRPLLRKSLFNLFAATIACAALLAPRAASITCTTSRHPRALEPIALAEALAAHCVDVRVMADPVDAYTYLLNAIPPEDVLVVTGSLFLVGELRAALRQSHVKPRRSAPLEAVISDDDPPPAMA